MKTIDLPIRLFEKIAPMPDGCWIWTAAVGGGGYGLVQWNGRVQPAHRATYEALVAPIPRTLVAHHECEQTFCVNPAHLRIVTQRENLLMGNGMGARHARKTHCPKGHPYDITNWDGSRGCRSCRNAYMRIYMQNRREGCNP